MRRMGTPGGASSGGTTRSFGISTGCCWASSSWKPGANIRIASMRCPSSVAWWCRDIARRQGIVFGHRQADQRRARSGRRKGAQPGVDAGFIQAGNDFFHAGFPAAWDIGGQVPCRIAVGLRVRDTSGREPPVRGCCAHRHRGHRDGHHAAFRRLRCRVCARGCQRWRRGFAASPAAGAGESAET